MKTANRAKKTSAGYDLTRLLIGSEGTLGIITELTLRLQGIPQAISAAICAFPDVEAACRTVIATIQYGIPVARIELLDEMQVRACNAHSRLDLPETPDAPPRVSRHASGRRGAGAGVRRDRGRVRRRQFSLRDARGGSAKALAGAARCVFRRPRDCALAPTSSRPMSACRSRGSPIASWRRRRTSRSSS